MSEDEFKAMQDHARQIGTELTEAVKTGDLTSEAAMEVADMHNRRLGYTWPALFSCSAQKSRADACR